MGDKEEKASQEQGAADAAPAPASEAKTSAPARRNTRPSAPRTSAVDTTSAPSSTSSDETPAKTSARATRPHHTICKVVGMPVTAPCEGSGGSKTYHPGDVAEFADSDILSLPELLKPIEE